MSGFFIIAPKLVFEDLQSPSNDETKSNPLADQKVRSITKSVLRFCTFPVSLRAAFAPKVLPALKYGVKMNMDKKLAS